MCSAPAQEARAMTVVLIDNRFEVFRVIDDPEMLVEAFRDRVEDLNTTRLGIDEAGGFTPGHASKLLCIPQIKGYGPESMFKMLKGTRLALMLVIDDERFGAAKPELIARQRPVPKPNAKPLSKAALRQIITGTFASHGKIGGLLRSSLLSPSQRKKIAKAGARARWRKNIRK